MITLLASSDLLQKILYLVGLLVAFAGTFVATAKLHPFLPKDAGREFAHDGKMSAGKPRGAGIIFVIAFAVTVLLFAPFQLEYVFYIIIMIFCMMTGYLDDASAKPWNEYKKAVLDLLVAGLTVAVYIIYNGTKVNLALFHVSFTMPIWLFAILGVLLIWTAINVTNCADGVDGLSGTVSIISMLTFGFVMQSLGVGLRFAPQIPMFALALAAYLWFNATPSKLMMGDAGSRTMGLFLAICALQTKDPFLFIPVCLVLMLDGGLGLIKVALLRFLKIHILKNVRTPLHDQVRKVWNWSNTQCVYRFAILQVVLGVLVVYLL